MAAGSTSYVYSGSTGSTPLWSQHSVAGDQETGTSQRNLPRQKRRRGVCRVALNVMRYFMQFATFLPVGICIVTNFGGPVVAAFSDGRTHHQLSIAIWGYGLPIVGFLLFLWEDAPWHYNREMEEAWLSVCIGCLAITTNLLAPPVWEHPQGMLDALSTWIVNVQLFRRVGTLRMHPKFHEGVGSGMGNQPAVVVDVSPKSIRTVSKLEALLAEVWDTMPYTNSFSIPDSVFPYVMFGIIFAKMMSHQLDGALNFVRCFSGVLFTLYLFSGLAIVAKRAFSGGHVQQLIDLVEELTWHCSPNELEFILTSFSVATLFEVTDWKTARHLTQKRVLQNLLTARSKAVLIDGIRKYGLRSNKAQIAVRRIFLSSEGEELTALKNLVDGSNTYQNLYYLLYRDITKTSVRLSILAHFATQARQARVEADQRLGIKVLSDIDDTFYASGGKFPAGCDKRYPKHVIYPGLLTFFDVLDKKRVFDSESCNLVFLSARPHLYKGLSEDRTYQSVKSVFRERGINKVPTLLPGNLIRGLRAVVSFGCLRSRAWKPVGHLKYDMYLNFRALYPEYDFIFCGDNGQGDLLAAQKMMASNNLSDANGPQLLAALIHQVLPDAAALTNEDASQRVPEWRDNLEETGIFLHASYVGAALAFHTKRPDLVNVRELASVTESAIHDFDLVRLMYSEWDCQEADDVLRADIDRANGILRANGREFSLVLRSRGELLDAYESSCVRSRPNRVLVISPAARTASFEIDSAASC
eukprot:TRINITY_DN29112_c0_g1_i1.p1 TRINITY_DN29112_c0_g1~~TRINITY_DN29112_c0_g1_i1.p1  ORF type:complete len:768 (+),score=51.07 TRINITY_DN29112_c0_g1_i1:44-2305(+)